jgi:hypothetical protein
MNYSPPGGRVPIDEPIRERNNFLRLFVIVALGAIAYACFGCADPLRSGPFSEHLGENCEDSYDARQVARSPHTTATKVHNEVRK